MTNVRRILARWDAIAYAQLTEHAARLATENDALRDQLAQAEDAARCWHGNWVDLVDAVDAGVVLYANGSVKVG
jgi:hypothetical protein